MPGEYLPRPHKPHRDGLNRGPHALPFSTVEEYTDVERMFLQVVQRLKVKLGPFVYGTDLCAALLAAGWTPPPVPVAGNEAAELASAVPAALKDGRKGAHFRGGR